MTCPAGEICPPVNSYNRLPIEISFYVPSKREGDRISDKAFQNRIDTVKEWMDRHMGGDTSVEGTGSYWDGEKLIKEDVVVVTAYTTTSNYGDVREAFGKFIKQKQRQWNQDTIGFSIDGDFFTYPYKEYIDHQAFGLR